VAESIGVALSLSAVSALGALVGNEWATADPIIAQGSGEVGSSVVGHTLAASRSLDAGPLDRADASTASAPPLSARWPVGPTGDPFLQPVPREGSSIDLLAFFRDGSEEQALVHRAGGALTPAPGGAGPSIDVTAAQAGNPGGSTSGSVGVGSVPVNQGSSVSLPPPVVSALTRSPLNPAPANGSGQPPGPLVASSPDTLLFHGDRARTGWNSNETVLTPANTAAHLGQVWESPVLDSVTLGTTTYRPHLYASPLYVDQLHVTTGPDSGKTVGAVIAATSTGFVYALEAFDTAGATNIPAGTILWRTSLGRPTPTIDGGVTVGVLSTPAIDLGTNRIYVTSDVTDSSGRNWDVFALDLGNGSVQSGWPLKINQNTLNPINQNGPTTWEGTGAESQRGALNLSPDGSILYVPFGAYGDGGAGWMVAVKTTGTPALASAFAGAPTNVAFANAGMWGSGGPAIDSSGNLMDTTGNSPSGSNNTPHVWGNSFLDWNPGTPLRSSGTYTPWNYSQMDQNDTDLGGGSPIVIDLDPATTSTPHLAAFGGKQGNAYLVDRSHLHGSLTSRQAPSTDSSTDTSLLPPGNQPQFGKRGPLNIFGPYSENSNNTDFAKSRSTPAYFQGPDGTHYVVFSGSAKTAVNSTTPTAPSLVLTKIVTAPAQPAYLAVVHQNNVPMTLPGSPVVTSNGSGNFIVWVVDAGVMRTDSLTSSSAIHPTLYAYDALTLRPLWSSAHNELDVGGKYDSPTVAHGTALFGTDRIQAFGLTTDTIVDDSVQGTGPNQFHYTGSGWNHTNPTTIEASFDGTLNYTDTANDSATISFTGTRVKFYAVERNNRGIAAVSIDGGAETNVDEFAAQDAGDVLVYTSPVLSAGSHTFKVRSTGTHDANSSGSRVDIDRVDLVP
jgi:hypothetical protein